ncbi:nucleotidyltransferase family protein [Raineya sp.]|jgi:hypothetical protein
MKEALLESHKKAIASLCQKHNVWDLYVFGSILTPHFNLQSDIDFLVKFGDIDLASYADNYFSLKFSLENLLHRKVDLLEIQALKNPYLRASIDKFKVLLYRQ